VKEAPSSIPARKTFKEEAISWAKAIGVAFVFWLFLRGYLVEAFRIPSGSMENTLLVGDFLFVNKVAFGGEMEIPFTGIHFIRLPGYGTPQMAYDTVIRNGQRLEEPYALHTDVTPAPDDPLQLRLMRTRQLPYYVGRDTARYHPTTHDWGPIVVPAGHYFMMGDNRDQSYDSRYWGFLPRAHIRGRPLFIYMSVARDPFRIRWNRLFRHPH